MFNLIVWILDACAVTLVVIGYWRFSRKADRIPLPDYPHFEHGDDPQRWLQEASDLHVQRAVALDERIMLRVEAIRWTRRGLVVGLVSVLVTLGRLVWLWL